jgi:ABC-type multidrug transport system fused ATPase/permease subunit
VAVCRHGLQATVALLYAAGAIWLRQANGDPISIGAIVAFVGYVWRFWLPVNNLANFYNALINSAAYIERIFEFLHEPVVIADKPEAAVLPRVTGKVCFEECLSPTTRAIPFWIHVTFQSTRVTPSRSSDRQAPASRR